MKRAETEIGVPSLALLTVVYFAAAKLGLQVAYLNPSATPVWPPTGIALAALLVLGYRASPAIWLGAFLANLATTGSLVSSAGIAVGNTVEALAGAWLVNRFAGGRHAVERSADLFKFAVLAAREHEHQRNAGGAQPLRRRIRPTRHPRRGVAHLVAGRSGRRPDRGSARPALERGLAPALQPRPRR